MVAHSATKSLPTALTLAVLVAVGILAVIFFRSPATPESESIAPAEPTNDEPPEVPDKPPRLVTTDGAPDTRAVKPNTVLSNLLGIDESAWAWHQIDLDSARSALPDNLFWTLAMPTDDPELLEARRQTRERWDRQFGQIQANTASEEDIQDYFAEREAISQDYVEIAGYLLEHYSEVLPERDIGMLGLARELHLERLAGYDRQQVEAQARRQAHAEVREQWLRDQALLDSATP